MDLSEFRRRLSTSGPEIHAWPDRDAALALLARSDDAVALLAATGDDTPFQPDAEAVMAAVRAATPE
jgi:hypothetical protein